MSEQKENLRKAEASLQDAEKRLTMVRKWQPRLQHAVLEYHASVQRLKDLSAADVPSAVHLLGRLIDALESYLSVQPPSGLGLESAPTSGLGRDGVDRDEDRSTRPRPRRLPRTGREVVEAEASRALDEEADAPAAADERPNPGRSTEHRAEGGTLTS